MKLKLFTIGLLATLAMTSTTVEAMQWQKKQAEAVQELPKVKQDLQVAQNAIAVHAAHPNLNIGGGAGQHADNNAAVDDLHTKLGTHAGAAGGDTANHRIDALHATLGHAAVGGAAIDHANKRAEDIAARLGAKTAHPTGPSVHEKVTDLMAIQGAITNRASAPGAKTNVVGANPGDLAGTAINNEEAILRRLKAWAALQVTALAAGRAVQVEFLANTTATPGTAPGNGIWLVQADWTAARNSNNIEAFLAALGM